MANDLFQSTPDLINRENVEVLKKLFLWVLFQSTPDLINRENIRLPRIMMACVVFQSTPDLINRENSVRSSALRAPLVAIHSRFN